MDQDGYPVYRRWDTGACYESGNTNLTNSDVVPYNPLLSQMFDCHINVEVCAGLHCVKYIHKYIYKGHDRATIVLGGQDEIKQYLDSRYIGLPEAAWRLFSFHMHVEVPNVVRLALHLPGMHHVIYNPSDHIQEIKERAKRQRSTLTSFFKCCASYSVARQYTYQEFPQHFVWDLQKKVWSPRQRGYAISRIYFAAPSAGERFYMRLLLTIVKGLTSFEDLRTVDGVVHNTFKSACVARSLLEDDNKWI